MVLLSLADQLDDLKVAPTEPSEAVPEPCEEKDTKGETPKKVKLADTEDPPKRHHKSRKEKSQSRHSLTYKSPASSSCEHGIVLKMDDLGDAVDQACLSVVRMSRVVEKAHNSKTTEALLMRQHLEKASVEAIDSMKEEIQGARASPDMWRIEKKITVQVSCKRAKAYCVLAQHHDSVSEDLTGKGGLSSGSSEMAEAEENFRKSISTLGIHSHHRGGTKISGEHRAALISSILCLVPSLPLDPVLTLTIDLPSGKECGITLGNTSWNVSAGQNIVSSFPSSPLMGGGSAPMVAGRSTIKFGQAVVWPVTFRQSVLDYPFFKRPASTPISMPKKGLGTPDACSSPLLKESHTLPEDAPDPTKSPTEPSMVVEDVPGNNDDDRYRVPEYSLIQC